MSTLCGLSALDFAYMYVYKLEILVWNIRTGCVGINKYSLVRHYRGVGRSARFGERAGYAVAPNI